MYAGDTLLADTRKIIKALNNIWTEEMEKNKNGGEYWNTKPSI